ncbi:MAG: GntR family transcriptional regulator [Anaerolineae bacterium]|nr:GntR family transcriptional regulator [Anaerolineae bacterium]
MTDYKVNPNDPLPRYYQVYASLHKRIESDEFSAGDALPSERQLANDYGVSRITIVKALDILERESFIERQHGRGNFVLNQVEIVDDEEDFTVTFFLPTYADSYLISVLIGAARVAMQHGIQMNIVGADQNANETKLIQHAIQTDANGILVFPRFRDASESFYKELVEKHYPLIMIDRYYPTVPADSVVFDDEAAGYALTDILIKRGHTKIAIFTGHEVTVSSVRNRLFGYQRALEAHGLPFDENLVYLDIYENLSPNSLSNLQTTYLELHKIIKNDAPTALIAINNPVAVQMNIDLMKIKTEQMQAVISGQVDKDSYELNISVAAISHKYITYDQSVLVAIAIQSGEILGEKAMALLIDRIKHPIIGVPQSITIPMKVVQLDKAHVPKTYE